MEYNLQETDLISLPSIIILILSSTFFRVSFLFMLWLLHPTVIIYLLSLLHNGLANISYASELLTHSRVTYYQSVNTNNVLIML